MPFKNIKTSIPALFQGNQINFVTVPFKISPLTIGFLFLFLSATLVLLCYLSHDIGITWDEPSYIYRAIHAGNLFHQVLYQMKHFPFQDAFLAFKDAPVWKDYPQVSFFSRYIHGTCYWLFNPWVEQPWVFRIGSSLLWCAMLLCLFLLANECFNESAGWLTLFMAIGCPRLVVHGMLATTETSLLAMWFFCIWIYWKCTIGNWPPWIFVLAWGIGLTAKFQMIILLPVLTLWGLLYIRKKSIKIFIWSIFGGPVLFFLTQPCYWLLFQKNIQEYLRYWLFHTNFPIPIYFLGTIYHGHGPWYYSPFILAVTLPVPFLFLTAAGIARTLIKPRPASVLFLMLALAPLIAMMFPNAPTFDGERLFIQAYPAFLLLAASAAQWLWEKIPFLKTIIPAASFVFSVYTLMSTHPFYMEYFNAMIGGAAGAQKAGMETSYWGDALNPTFLKKMNQELPPNSKLWLVGLTPEILDYEKSIGWIRPDIHYTRQFEPDVSYLLIYARQGLMTDPAEFQKMTAMDGVFFQGTPIVKLVKKTSRL